MILDVIISGLRIVFGLTLALFLPGYLVARIFFKELSGLEKVAIAFVISISIDIFLGLFLGYNEQMKNLTGGITATNLWLHLSLITLILLVIYMTRRRDEVEHVIEKIRKKEK
jgi:uncharacterized membrane protein